MENFDEKCQFKLNQIVCILEDKMIIEKRVNAIFSCQYETDEFEGLEKCCRHYLLLENLNKNLEESLKDWECFENTLDNLKDHQHHIYYDSEVFESPEQLTELLLKGFKSFKSRSKNEIT